MGFEELLALVTQRCESSPLEVALDGGVLALHVEFFEDQVAYVVEGLPGRLLLQVVVLDEGLDFVDADGGLGAVGALLLPSDADEVWVDGAVAVLGVGDDQAAAAVAAEDAALEVVVVLAGLLPGLGLVGEHFLDSVPDDLVDQRLVTAFVFDSAVADDADVVRVLEQPVEVRQHEWLRWGFRSGC